MSESQNQEATVSPMSLLEQLARAMHNAAELYRAAVMSNTSSWAIESPKVGDQGPSEQVGARERLEATCQWVADQIGIKDVPGVLEALIEEALLADDGFRGPLHVRLMGYWEDAVSIMDALARRDDESNQLDAIIATKNSAVRLH